LETMDQRILAFTSRATKMVDNETEFVT
jgi:hypothetical protein